jgi:hypothetical protein
MPDPCILIALALRRGAQGLRLAADLLDPPRSPDPIMMFDERCLRDGAYSRDQRTGALVRCLGQRLHDPGGVRFGFEDVLDPGDVRWVVKGSISVRRLRFVCQGDPSNEREVVEAMR